MRLNCSSFKAICMSILLFAPNATIGGGARFVGDVVVAWLSSTEKQDRLMRLEREFSYIDSLGKYWTVPKGTKVDGASIPPLFWSTIGPPFVGDYRRASVVHDFFCQTKSKPWKKVHQIFYEASIVGGVSVIRAKVMYAAVYAGGPRWPEPGRLDATVTPNPEVSAQELVEIGNWITENNPLLSEIEARLESIN